MFIINYKSIYIESMLKSRVWLLDVVSIEIFEQKQKSFVPRNQTKMSSSEITYTIKLVQETEEEHRRFGLFLLIRNQERSRTRKRL